MTIENITITGEQVRAARALLRIEQKQLAAEAKLSLETIKRLESFRGSIDANLRTLKAIRTAFFRLGAVFDDREDVGKLVGTLRTDLTAGGGARTVAQPDVVADDDEPLVRLIYHSSQRHGPAEEKESNLVAGIARESVARNRRREVTGALLACNGFFLQALEGPKDWVSEIYESIKRDRRHDSLRLLQNKPVDRRVFRKWSMLPGNLPALDEIIVDDLKMKNGFDPGALTPAEALGLLLLVVLSSASQARSILVEPSST